MVRRTPPDGVPAPGPARRPWLWLWAPAALAAAALAAAVLHPAASAVSGGWRAAARAAGVDPGTPLGGSPAPGFTLTDQFGAPRSLASFRGKVVVLSFIDSRCTTICPTTAQEQRDALEMLGPAAAEVQLLAVNANPQATAVSDVRAWSAAHGLTRHWLFLTGPPRLLARVWRAYGIYVAVVNGGIDHTPATYVIDRRGREQFLFTTTGDFSGTRVQAGALAECVASLLTGHVALAGLPPAAAGPPPPPGGAFTLPALAPSGRTVRVALGGAPGGDRLRLVAFFATWCPACREDMASLQAYAVRSAADPGLPPLAAVDLRVAEPSTAAVRRFVAGQHLGFPVALDATGRVADAYGVTDLPYLALASGQGRILWRHVGVLRPRELQAQVASAAAGSG